MQVSERMASKLEARLDDWIRHVSKREDIIFGLLEILRESLNLRMNAISKYIRMKKGEETEERRATRLVPFKRKKVTVIDDETGKRARVDAVSFSCEHCGHQINITKKMK